MKLRDLKGLGPSSEAMLMEVGIASAEHLREVGAVEAFLRLKRRAEGRHAGGRHAGGRHASGKPSLNFLYAMVGALEDRHWLDIAQTERMRLLMELDGYKELERLLQTDR